MKRIFTTLIALWSVTTMAGLPPTSIKGSGDANYSTFFKLNLGNQSISKNGTEAYLNSSSDKNYILNPDAEVDVTGWSTYADAAGTSPVDMTGGSPASTFTRSTSSPLNDLASFVFSKSAANRQGEGFSYNFSIDSADTTKVLRIDFNYKVSSGTYADDDMQCWIYDTTNSALIQPAPFKIKNATGIEPAAMEFQATTSTSYRFGCHVASTSTSAYDLKFDKFKISRGPKVYSTAETEFRANVTTTSGAVSNEDRDFISSCTAANPTVCTFTTGYFTVAPNCLVATSKSTDNVMKANLNSVSSSGFTVQTLNTNTGANFDSIPFEISCKKAGVDYTSATAGRVSSSEADTRVTNFVGAKTSSQSVTASTTDISFTTVKDSHGAWNGSRYIVPSPGDYIVGGFISSSVTTGIQLYVNNVYYGRIGVGAAAITVYGSIANAKAGDIISIRSDTSGTIQFDSTAFKISITKVSGPSQIAASETVSASYYVSANFAASTTTPINFDSKEFDSHGSVTTSPTAWKFTAPASGIYQVSATTYVSATAVNYSIYKNGSAYLQFSNHQSGGVAVGSTTIRLLAGEYIDLRPGASVTVAGGSLASIGDKISITRVGNY